MQYLTATDIIYINSEVIRIGGGKLGIRDINLIHSASNRPQTTFDKKNLYPGLFRKAASLFHSIISNHAFIDGNKRTAIASAATMLYLNGYELSVTNSKLESFTLKALKEKYLVKDIAKWLKANSKKIKRQNPISSQSQSPST